MNNIIWIFQNVLGFAVTAVIVVMQPELRHALEQLGEKNFLPLICHTDAPGLLGDNHRQRVRHLGDTHSGPVPGPQFLAIGFSSSSRKEEDTFSEKTVSEIAKASMPAYNTPGKR